MSARLVGPAEAGLRLGEQIEKKWAEAVCAETRGEAFAFTVRLRPNVTSGAVVERHLLDSWGEWRTQWRRLDLPAEAGTGAWVDAPVLPVVGSLVKAPKTLHAPDLESAEAALLLLGERPTKVDVARARDIARRLHSTGSLLTAGLLKKVVGLNEADLDSLIRVLDWLTDQPDLSRWSARQVPIPRVHTKWLDKNLTLVRGLTGRDVNAEVRQRPTAVHLTYVDPDYLAQGRRRHDAWTAGDHHEVAYEPHTVLVVENRDCRVFFPELQGTIVIEGGGSAATALVAEIPWVRDAGRVVYWGDMDADGYAILARFRAALPNKVSSILMDYVTMNRFADQGVNVDKDGRQLNPCATPLPDLDDAELAAYATIATSGPAKFRRIEQEKLPIGDAVAALESR